MWSQVQISPIIFFFPFLRIYRTVRLDVWWGLVKLNTTKNCFWFIIFDAKRCVGCVISQLIIECCMRFNLFWFFHAAECKRAKLLWGWHALIATSLIGQIVVKEFLVFQTVFYYIFFVRLQWGQPCTFYRFFFFFDWHAVFINIQIILKIQLHIFLWTNTTDANWQAGDFMVYIDRAQVLLLALGLLYIVTFWYFCSNSNLSPILLLHNKPSLSKTTLTPHTILQYNINISGFTE